ncbi:MAG: glycosyltransferase family 2 protein [Candidatus Saccharibacteria bacterium]|nr:glycosyltransferase family 2 protein [Candidatus Saccharibacteria bacterium]
MIKAITVIIPSYNAASWLSKTIPKVDKALKISGVEKAEIIVVDDGSSDNSKEVVKKISTKFPLKYYKFENGGRFLARKRGTEKAKFDHILFIDTRIFIAPKGLNFIIDTQAKQTDRQVWTSHVHLDREGNMYARFWEAITFVAWRRYFANPRDMSYGIKDFDMYPKGTTCFFVPKTVIEDANSWFEKNTKDTKTSNDDTLLIRRIAEKNSININPEFSCTYHARTNLKQFIKHVYHRGKVFVDGFLRRDGNRFYYPLLAFLGLSVVVPVVLVLMPKLIIPFLALFVASWIMGFAALLILGVNLKDAISFFILSPLFLFVYGGGIWNAFVKIYVRPLFSK